MGESQWEAGEEPAKDGWTRGQNMDGERLMKGADALRVERRRRRGRPRLRRWEKSGAWKSGA